jgi:hypothetical protein
MFSRQAYPYLSLTLNAALDSSVTVANTKYNSAVLYRRQGNNIQARILFHEAAAVNTIVYGPRPLLGSRTANHSETIDALNQAKN